ncbi:MAG: hypothetical protein EXS42_02700 [Lacunisphaera sp.]|nr:hypothetical protein [Lacunisphaera sp.]
MAPAADQYFLENGASSVACRNLAHPTNFVKAVSRGCGETIRVEPEVQIEQATGDQFRQSLYSLWLQYPEAGFGLV